MKGVAINEQPVALVQTGFVTTSVCVCRLSIGAELTWHTKTKITQLDDAVEEARKTLRGSRPRSRVCHQPEGSGDSPA